MSGDPQRSPILVDLTTLNDDPPHPLLPPPRPRTRKRPNQVAVCNTISSSVQDDNNDDDLEIIDVRESELDANDRKRRRMLRKMEQRRNAASTQERLSSKDTSRPKRRLAVQNAPSNEISIVEERQLTPQERLKAIQQQHARGETIQLDQSNSIVLQQPRQLEITPLHMHGQQRLRRRSIISQFLQHFRRYPRFGFWNESLIDYNNPNPNALSFQDSDEQNLQRVMESSMFDTWQSAVNVSKIKKPVVPAAIPGFTFSLAQPENLICIKCHHPLGTTKHIDWSKLPSYTEAIEQAKISETQSSKIYVRGCNHVYCGACTHEMKFKSPKERKCPGPNCHQVNAKKRGQFREVFL